MFNMWNCASQLICAVNVILNVYKNLPLYEIFYNELLPKYFWIVCTEKIKFLSCHLQNKQPIFLDDSRKRQRVCVQDSLPLLNLVAGLSDVAAFGCKTLCRCWIWSFLLNFIYSFNCTLSKTCIFFVSFRNSKPSVLRTRDAIRYNGVRLPGLG